MAEEAAASNSTSGSSGALASGGMILAPIISSIMGQSTAKWNTKRTIRANRNMAERAYAHDKEMWNLSNQYNSPLEQMARLKAAGLNPNLVYGSGAPGNSSSSLPKYNTPNLEVRNQPLNVDSLGGVLSAYQDYRMRNAQINNVDANTETTKADADLKRVNAGLGAITGNKRQLDLDLATKYSGDLMGAQLETRKAELQRSLGNLQKIPHEVLRARYESQAAGSRVHTAALDTELRQAQLLFQQNENDLRKMGVQSGDNLMLRIIVRMMNDAGFDVTKYNPFK